MEYRFEELQQLRFIVYDVDDRSRVDDERRQEIIGELSCSLADIVTAGEQYTKTLRYNGEQHIAVLTSLVNMCIGS